MKTSVAMTTYNGERYLRAQLESIATQTTLPDELVVCDDGSTDGTLDVLHAFATTAPFEVSIHQNEANLGFTRNFEKALSLCRHEVVYLADQDDVWRRTKVERTLQSFAANPHVMLVVHDGLLVDNDLVGVVTKLSQVESGFGSSDGLVMGALTAVRRRFVNLALPFPDALRGHDVWLHRLAAVLRCRTIVREDLQLLRRHANNTSGWIASSIKPINRVSVLRAHAATPPAQDYSDRLALNLALEKRALEAPREHFPYFDGERAHQAFAAERDALRRRSALVRSPPMRRRAAALSALLRGDYHLHFNRWGSFLRDFTR